MKKVLIACAMAVAAGLSACATPTPYQPLTHSGPSSGGYSDLKISSDRYRISFEGNTVTDRERVERYLLYHAADLALKNGADWFMLTNRRTDTDKRRSYSPDFYGGWAPEWEYFGPRRGWALVPRYDPFWGGSYDVTEYSRFRANAEILLGKGPKPANDPAAFDAHEVAANLAPTIAQPKTPATGA